MIYFMTIAITLLIVVIDALNPKILGIESLRKLITERAKNPGKIGAFVMRIVRSEIFWWSIVIVGLVAGVYFEKTLWLLVAGLIGIAKILQRVLPIRWLVILGEFHVTSIILHPGFAVLFLRKLDEPRFSPKIVALFVLSTLWSTVHWVLTNCLLIKGWGFIKQIFC